MAVDRAPSRGPLSGVLSALDIAAADRSFVVAVDYPGVTLALAHALLGVADGHLGAIPLWRAQLHPACAVYSRAVRPSIEAELADQGRLRALAAEPGVLVVDCDSSSVASRSLIAAVGEAGLDRALANLNSRTELEVWLSRRS